MKIKYKLRLMFFDQNHNLNSICPVENTIALGYVIHSFVYAVWYCVSAGVLLFDSGLFCIIITSM